MKRLLSTLLLMLVTMAMMAVPAKKGVWRTITLENGKEVRALLKGDEFGHYWHTADGKHYVAVDGQYKEETPAIRQLAAQRRAQAQSHRAARLPRPAANGKRRASAAHVGEKKGLILLVNFQDVQFRNGVTLYNNVANTPGYTDDNGFQGSVADYFKDQSRDQFELTFDVVGPVTVSKESTYYGKNDSQGNDMHAEEMVVEAVKLAKSQGLVTNWKQYDWDNDGKVDQVMILYAGEGEADGGSEDTIWPHEWELKYAGKDFEITAGIKISTYAVANECYMGNGEFHINGIGTICHEFSHCLGLPDMYDVRYGGNFGMGNWSLMDGGCYNADGFVPSGYTSYDRYSIGWIEPVELTEAQEVSRMQALMDADDVYIIKNPAHPDEYYLLENRQQKGWDTYVPASGMLILHVDYNPMIWSYNLVNANSDGSDGYPKNDHQRCTIFHADGMDRTADVYNLLVYEADKLTDAEYNEWRAKYYADMREDVYPQSYNNQLTNTSKPRAFLYNENTDGRKLMNISITDITQNTDGTIAFKFAPDDSGTEEGDNTVYGLSDGPDIEGVLFYESFNKCLGTGGNDNLWFSSVANGEFVPDNEGWTSAKAFGADRCAKFGTGSVNGAATTPAFAVNGTSVLNFKAGAWIGQNDGTTLKLSVSNGTITPSSVEMVKGKFTDYEATISATGSVAITFEAEKGRFFLDEVLVIDASSTAIRKVEATGNKTARIYTLDGRYVGSDYQRLSRGIYIVDGKKVVK